MNRPIPTKEQWLHNNPSALAFVQQDLTESAHPFATAIMVAVANKEQVHRMSREGVDNEHRAHLFRSAYEDELPESELTDRVIISAMAHVELMFYS